MICTKYEDCPYEIQGVSYVGNPRSYTAMYASKKIQRLLVNLENVEGCLIFVEAGSEIPKDALGKNCFVQTDNPQGDYTIFAVEYSKRLFEIERTKKYVLTDGGYYIGEDVTIGENAYIEPGCLIGHGVRIGKNAIILSNAVIKRATIGNDFLCNEGAAIGTNGFTMADDSNGNKVRIPTLGKVEIGNNVEVGANDNICCGSAGSTIIEDNVKLDALVHLGHDVHIRRNVEITAGSILGGFVDAGERSFIGLNAAIKNRVKVGDRALVGMGSSVVLPVKPEATVMGQMAKPFKTFDKKSLSST